MFNTPALRSLPTSKRKHTKVQKFPNATNKALQNEGWGLFTNCRIR